MSLPQWIRVVLAADAQCLPTDIHVEVVLCAPLFDVILSVNLLQLHTTCRYCNACAKGAAWFRKWWRRGFAYSMLHEVLTWAKSRSTDEVLPEVKRLRILLKVALLFQYHDLTYICHAVEK